MLDEILGVTLFFGLFFGGLFIYDLVEKRQFRKHRNTQEQIEDELCLTC